MEALKQPVQGLTIPIYRAIFMSLLIVGIFYIFMAYASAIGWGTGNMAAFATASTNPYYTLAQKFWGIGWWLVLFAIINSTLAVGIACTNAATRVMYTMAQAGTLPSPLRLIRRTGPMGEAEPSPVL